MIQNRLFSAFVGVLLFVSFVLTGEAQEVQKRDKPSEAAVKAINNFRYPDRFKVETYASEPLLKNPVTFTFDRQGRVYVGETHRWRKGINDNRAHWYWLMDDLASDTVQDRLEKFRKWAKKGKQPMSYYRKFSEKVRLLRDTDDDGYAERSRVFADGFDSAVAGPAAGLLFYRDNLYMTCIPYLWMLRDGNGDGKAEKRKKLHGGFGLRTSLSGHDMHGLALGPDGRIYFSIGDRGYNVKTEDGRRLVPDIDAGRGAVFRCEPDGSNLEVVHQGLRNPQELAFDSYGNLFSVDNQSDAKDKGRLVYVVEGGDSGWMMPFQYMDRWDAYNVRGAWQEEGLWKTHFDEQPDWIVPPIDHVVEGPSGLVHYPGTGFPDSYDGHFFVCDFHGSPKSSGIQTFSVSKDGASFSVDATEKFIWQVAATDVDFGYDGKMYLTDWITGWGMTGKGRVYTVFDPETAGSKEVREVQRIFKQGFRGRSVSELAGLLSHADQRVRLRAHLALAGKGTDTGTRALWKYARNDENALIPRLHGIWGTGVVARRRNTDVLSKLKPLLSSERPEIRAQVLRVMGEAGYQSAAEEITKRLSDQSARVRYFAAQALADLGHEDALEPVIRMFRRQTEDRPYLLHAGVMLLKEVRAEDLLTYGNDPSPRVRTAVLLALRRKKDPRVARFLEDGKTKIVAEAARAIYDLNINKALPELAGVLDRTKQILNRRETDGVSNLTTDALFRRAMNANFRLRKPRYLRNVAEFAANESVRKTLRKEAVRLLKNWVDPKPIDRVLGRYLEYNEVDRKQVRSKLEEVLPELLASSSGKLQSAVTDLASTYGLETNEQFFVRTLKSSKHPPGTRAKALEYLARNDYEKLSNLVDRALQSKHPVLRIKAREVLARKAPKRAFRELRNALNEGTIRERQAALDTLSSLDLDRVDTLLAKKLSKLIETNVPEEIRLDLLKAARKRSSGKVKKKLKKYEKSVSGSDPLGEYRVALKGGNPERGERIFKNHSSARCIRCHKIDGTGGNAGPDLSDVGARKDRTYILRSMIDPGADIARGFQLVTVQLEGGKTVSGTVSSESQNVLSIATPSGKVVRIQKDRIKERSQSSSSSMPPMGNILTKGELRDLVSYLSSLDGQENR